MAIAAVMIKRGVVEPIWVLGMNLRGCDDRFVGEASFSRELWKGWRRIETVISHLMRVERPACDVAVWGLRDLAIGGVAVFETDYIGRVVDDNVEVNAQPASVSLSNELTKF